MSSSREAAQALVDEDADLEGLAPPGESVEAVLADVQAAVNDLANLDVDVEEPADLERVRQGLPTEPHRAVLVQAALPEPLRSALVYVRPSDRQAGYWRRSPGYEDPGNLSDAQLRVRHAFATAGRAERGTEGVTTTADGRTIPEAAERIGDRVAAAETGPADGPDEEKGKGILDRIMDRL